MIGQTISHYKIIDKLGQGGMGEVYLAEDMKLGRNVALKFIPEALRQDPEAVERLMREARAASVLDHPNILTIHGVEQEDDRDFIVMAYVEGQDLSSYASSKELQLDKILKLTDQIAGGLQAAHEAGITHRDLKPANILVDARGRARILDFGLAKVEGASKLTQTGSTVGTVAYSSPEQTQGREVDTRTDVFSLGIVLYELITGRRPFGGDHEAAVLYAIANEEPEPLARYKSDVSDELQRLVAKCLQKDPAARYQSAADLRADLRSVRARYAPSTSDPPIYLSKRRRRTYALAGVAMLLLIFFVGPRLKFSSSPPVDERKMIAVLPFDNLGSPDDEYFADGITEEITSRLATLSGLGVISRTSAMKYKDTDKDLPQIADELGVDYLLEGSLRWDKSGSVNKVRITPQLIRVRDNTHVWADNYERELDQIFSVQADIATRIASALNVTLVNAEQQVIESRPTDNLEAYTRYLQARSLLNQFDVALADSFLQLSRSAVELDSTAGEFWAQLSLAHTQWYWFLETNRDLLDSSKFALDHAVRLAPDHPETHHARALYYYHGLRDYDRALEELEHVIALQPNSAPDYGLQGAILRRRGEWQAALEAYRKAYRLDPRDPLVAFDLGGTLAALNRFDEADDMYEISLALGPRNIYAYLMKIVNDIRETGTTESARKDVARFRTPIGPIHTRFFLCFLNLFDHRFRSALDSLPPPDSIVLLDTLSHYSVRASLLHWMNEPAATLVADSGCAYGEAWITRSGDSTRFADVMHMYAIAGNAQRAYELCERLPQQFSREWDAWDYMDILRSVAETYIMLGEYDRALDILENIVNRPGGMTPTILRIYPDYDALRDHPRFEALANSESIVF